LVTAKIDADAMLVEAIFQRFYVVPDFQREYVWKKRHVNQLLEDLFRSFMSGGSDEYFLGSMVLHREEDGYHLVDGQQRITTLYILIAGLRDRFKQLDPGWDTTPLDMALKSAFVHKGGVSYRYRVQPQYAELAKVLQSIGDGHGEVLTVPDAALPGFNMARAYKFIQLFLNNRFGENPEQLQRFFGFLWDNVELISIETQDMRTAFTIFETLNDRGVGLDALDLLKNLLFRETELGERTELNGLWREMVKALRDGGETRPIRFLRYYLVANNHFDRMPTASGLFSWIGTEENKKALGYGRSPLKFMDKLLFGAFAYANFNQGQNEDGTENQFLRGILYQKTGVRQHLALLLAARHLTKTGFLEITRWIENLVFVYALTGLQWNALESALPTWTENIRNCRVAEDVEEFIHSSIRPAIEDRSDLVWGALEDTRLVSPRLLKYLLAAITQFVEEETGKGGGFDSYFKEKLSIEHILPQSPSREWKNTFGGSLDITDYMYRLGNLTLLHSSPNSSGGNLSFPEKKKRYAKSTYDLTRALAIDIRDGKRTKTVTAVEKLDLLPVDEWTAQALDKRHQMMMRIVSQIWEIPLPHPKLSLGPAEVQPSTTTEAG
jgi:hypothetical protein